MSTLKLSKLLETERFFEDTLILNRIGIDSNVYFDEDDQNLIVKMNLPEIHPDKIDVYVKNDYLHIIEIKEEAKEEDGETYSKEIYKESFEQMIKLPYKVDENNIDFYLNKGELTVVLSRR